MQIGEEDPACREAVDRLAVGAFGFILTDFVLRRCDGNHQVAEDLLQDVWRKVWKARGTWTPESPRSAARYVFTVAANLLRDTYRAEARREKLRKAAMAEALTPPSALPLDLLIDLRNGWSKLDQNERHLLEETVIKERTNADVAAELGVSEEAIKKRRQRALAQLRRFL